MNSLSVFKGKLNQLPVSVRAGTLILIGVFLLGLSDNLVLLINDETGIWQFHAIRSFITTLLIIGLVIIFRYDIRPKKPLFVLLRSIFLSAAMICYFGGLSFLSVAEAGAGLFSSPIFVLIFSVIIFKIRIGIFRILAVILGSIGVYVLLKPDFSEFNLLQIIPVLGGMFYAMAVLSTRHFCSEESAIGLTLAYLCAIGIIGAIVATTLSLFPTIQNNPSEMFYFLEGWRPVSIKFLVWITLQAILTVVALAFMTKAYQMTDTSILAVYEYGFLVFAALWGWVLWSTVLGLSEVIGITFIIVAGIIIITRSARVIS